MRRSAWLSTSPLSTPTTNGGSAPPGCSISSLFTGWALGSEMMPTLAQRVCPSTATWARSLRRARRSRSSSTTAARIARVLSPSSPISAAALYTTREAAPGEAGGAGLEQRVAGPVGHGGGDRRVVDVEVVVPHEHVETGRVAAAHLHAVDRRQRLLDGEVAGQRGRTGVAPGEVGDRGGRAQAIAPDRPQRVAQRDQLGAAPARGRRRRGRRRPARRRSRPRRRRAGRGGRRSPAPARGARRGRAGPARRGARRRPRRGTRRRRRRHRAAASAASSPASTSAGDGTGRVGDD